MQFQNRHFQTESNIRGNNSGSLKAKRLTTTCSRCPVSHHSVLSCLTLLLTNIVGLLRCCGHQTSEDDREGGGPHPPTAELLKGRDRTTNFIFLWHHLNRFIGTKFLHLMSQSARSMPVPKSNNTAAGKTLHYRL